MKPAEPWRDIGEALLDAEGGEHGREYLKARGWSDDGIQNYQFRWIDGDDVKSYWPKAMRLTVADGKKEKVLILRPEGAVILPFPNDRMYCVARIFYKNGTHEDAPKFLTPGGVPLKAYIPKAATKKTTRIRYFIESPFKAALANNKGLVCIGVNGCDGCHVKGERLPDLPDRKISKAQARQWFRPELLPFLTKKQIVVFVTDADCETNLAVRRTQLDFLDAAAALGCLPEYQPLSVSLPGTGGLDDFLVDNDVTTFRALPRYKRKSRTVRILRNPFRDRTEFGMADRFVVIHGGDIRFDGRTKEWYVWKDGYWQRNGTHAFDRMRDAIATLKDEAKAEHNPDLRKERDKKAIDFQTESKMKACVSIATSDSRIHIDSATFDADCNLIGLQNGTLDLNTGKLVPAERSHMITKRAPVTFDPEAEAPLFDAFIRRACNDDDELIELCQEIYGAMLLGRPIRTEVIFVQGVAFTGKTVYLEIGKELLGDYATATKSEMLLRQNRQADAERPSPFLMELRGKRLVTCSELAEGGLISETMIKDLTGGDTITARSLNKPPCEFRNTARVIVRCNQLPAVAGTDDSIWKRIIIIPFSIVIPPEERDQTLRETITATELPGVLNWALAGLRRYAKRGYVFDVPESVQNIVDKHRRESDVLGLWIDDGWEVDKTETAEPYRTLQSVITADYMTWCETNNAGKLSAKNLWSRLRERFGYDPIKPLDGGHKYALGWKPMARSKEHRAPSEPKENKGRSEPDTVDERYERLRKILPFDSAKRRRGGKHDA